MTFLHFWGFLTCNIGDFLLQLWVFLVYNKQELDFENRSKALEAREKKIALQEKLNSKNMKI